MFFPIFLLYKFVLEPFVKLLSVSWMVVMATRVVYALFFKQKLVMF